MVDFGCNVWKLRYPHMKPWLCMWSWTVHPMSQPYTHTSMTTRPSCTLGHVGREGVVCCPLGGEAVMRTVCTMLHHALAAWPLTQPVVQACAPHPGLPNSQEISTRFKPSPPGWRNQCTGWVWHLHQHSRPASHPHCASPPQLHTTSMVPLDSPPQGLSSGVHLASRS